MSKEEKNTTITQTGECRFCRQIGHTEALIEWDEVMVNEAITYNCECEQAQAYVIAKERKDKAKRKHKSRTFGE